MPACSVTSANVTGMLAMASDGAGLSSTFLTCSVLEQPMARQVSEVMTRDVLTCAESDDVKVAARTMKDNQVRRLLVVDDNHKVSGIVSLGDVAVEGNDKMSGDVLEKVSIPSQGKKA